MNQFTEFEGKNIDQALAKASEEMNVPVEKLEYDVVSYGSSGIFGLVGAKKAKIRIKSDFTTDADIETKAQARDLVKDAFELADERETTDDRRSDNDDNVSEKNDIVQQMTPEKENAVNAGKDALQRIIDFITENSQITIENTGQRIVYRVEGGNSGMLIGKRGQTLEAIQYLVEKVVNKTNGQRIRVLVDVEGYLKTRKSNLQKLAAKMAEKAQKSKKPVTIGQMNAYDRRTVHMFLKNNNAVRTQSVGDGYYRKLIVFPKKGRRGRTAN